MAIIRGFYIYTMSHTVQKYIYNELTEWDQIHHDWKTPWRNIVANTLISPRSNSVLSGWRLDSGPADTYRFLRWPSNPEDEDEQAGGEQLPYEENGPKSQVASVP